MRSSDWIQRRLRSFHRDEAGDSVLEMGLSVTLMLAIIFGVMDFSRAMYAYHFVSNAAREATRYAMVRGASWGANGCSDTSASSCNATADNVEKYVLGLAPSGVALSNVVVTTTWTGLSVNGASCGSITGNDPGCVVSVQVQYNYNFVLPLLPNKGLTFVSTSKMVIAE